MNDVQFDAISLSLDDLAGGQNAMAEGLKILTGMIGEIHQACCGEQPTSELVIALRALTAAIDEQSVLISKLVDRFPPIH